MCKKRQIENADDIHARVAERLGDITHPLLSRAVLVKRLLDVASEAGSLASLLQQIGNSPNDYFAVFVHTNCLNEKLMKNGLTEVGEPHQPLLNGPGSHRPSICDRTGNVGAFN